MSDSCAALFDGIMGVAAKKRTDLVPHAHALQMAANGIALGLQTGTPTVRLVARV